MRAQTEGRPGRTLARSAAAAIRLLLAAAWALTLAGPAGAEEASLYPWEGPRLRDVPSPEAVLGFPLGARLAGHADAARYLEALDAASDRVRLFEYARSHEGRLLRYAAVSSPVNLERLAEHRLSIQRLSNPVSLPPEEAGALLRETPVLVWLAYSVHGDEHSSTEAALAVAYHLASADDERTRAILGRAVIFVDPLQNPDGRERFVRTYEQAAGPLPRADPYAAEHDEPWPSGRFNHDLFDLNRDWFWLTQPETRGKVAAFVAWRPQVFVDHHEMGSNETYYFAPPTRPINPNVADAILKWFKVLGAGNARTFDALGFDYYTEERFDLFYPGYGDSWPSLNGAVGMTYEQATAAGLVIERKDGSVLTLRDAIRRHVAAGLATAETAAANREEMLRDFHEAARSALADGSAGSPRAYLIPADRDPGGAGRMARLLAAQGIEVRAAEGEFTVRAAPAGDGAVEARKFARGTFVAPAAQPSRRLLAALFDRDPRLDERVVEEAAERRRLREDSPFYDVTAWSLSLAMNVPVFVATETPKVGSAPLAPADRGADSGGVPGHAEPPAGFGPWPPPVDGPAPGAPSHAAGAPPAPPAGPAPPARAGYAYLLPPAGNESLAALVSLLGRKDLNVQVATRKFSLAGRSFPPGTAVLKVHRNPAALHEAVAGAAARFGAAFEPASTGLTDEGIDLGSRHVVHVGMPRIAVLYGEPASPTSVGWLAYVLGERAGAPFVPLRSRSLARDADLRRYDVVVLPDGDPSSYLDALGAGGVKRVKAWIEAGGTLVALKGASALAAHKDVAWASVRRVQRPRASPVVPAAAAPEASGSSTRGGGPSAEPAEREAGDGEMEDPDPVPGAILRVVLEPTHPLAFGYEGEVPVIVTSNLVLSVSKDGRNPAVFAPADRLRLGGFAWKESLDLLAGKPYAVVERLGRGSVVLFADDPNFRGGWEGLTRMLLNALLLVPALEP